MSFHALLVVRDEADVLPESLTTFLRWADFVHVFDTGSADESWDIVNEFAAKDKRVRPLLRKPVFYDESSVRSELFHLGRDTMKDGDWLLRVDADEFHHISPPDFVKNHILPGETSIWHQYYEFAPTDSDLAAWRAGGDAVIMEDRKRPLEDRLRHYRLFTYAEPRMFQYRDSMVWPSNRSCPYNTGFIAARRLPIRHYPNRDPLQMRRRCALRYAMMSEKSTQEVLKGDLYLHWLQDWETFVHRDDDPILNLWEPGKDLDLVINDSHLDRAKKWQRALLKLPVSRLLYTPLSRIRDRTHKDARFVTSLRPIAPEQNERITQAILAVQPSL
jgi:glycosyltransferase involved in cell wall biosynthesis